MKNRKFAEKFDKEKHDVMKNFGEIDKSRKGSVDADILHVITFINSLDDYYTTSSCSGRIMLMDKSDKRKDLTKWLLSSHDEITYADYDNVFNPDYLSSDDFKKSKIWFMQEPSIFHVCCRDLDSARNLLNIVRNLGFKRAGIISYARRIIIEIIDNEKLESLIAVDGELFVTEKYSRVLIDEVNYKLRRTKERLDLLYDELQILNDNKDTSEEE